MTYVYILNIVVIFVDMLRYVLGNCMIYNLHRSRQQIRFNRLQLESGSLYEITK